MRRASRSPSEPELSEPLHRGRAGARKGAGPARSADAAAFEREFPGASWLCARVVRELEEVGAMAEALVASVAQPHGLSHASLNALAVIEGHGGPMSVGDVSASMHITSGTMTGVLDTLVRNGYVKRLADPEDRRRVLVDVTPRAQAVLNELLPEVVQSATATMAPFDDAQLEELLVILGAVREAIAGAPRDLAPPAPRRLPRRLLRG